MKANTLIKKLSIIENNTLVLSIQAYHVYSSCIYKPTMERYKEIMVDFLSVKSNHVYFCMCEEEIIGMMSCSIKKNMIEIIGIATSPDYRKLGIGKFMI